MENNKLIGYALLFGLIFFFLKHNEKKVDKQDNANVENVIKKTVQKDIFAILKNHKKDILKEGQEKEYSLENDEMKVTFSNLGGSIKNIELKNYKNSEGKNVVLLDENSAIMNFILKNKDKNEFESALNFFKVINSDRNKIEFEYTDENSNKITEIFELSKENKFAIKHFFSIANGFDDDTINFSFYDLLKQQEHNLENCRNNSTIKYCTKKNEVNAFSEISTKEEKKNASNLKWISFKQKFFTTGIKLENENTNITMELIPSKNDYVKDNKVDVIFADKNISMQYYFGPNKYTQLKKFANRFEQNIYYGIPGVRVFNIYIISPLTDFLNNHGVSLWIIIILLALLLKLLLLPLNWKSYKMMATMKFLSPALKILNEKYKNDAQTLAIEQMKLYRECQINPLGSLIPILLQFPFIIAMFNFIPSEIIFRHKGFLWCKDLSNYDSILDFGFNIPFYGDHISLFALLMTFTTLVYTLYNSKSNEMTKASMFMMIFFPLFFLGISNKFCAALNFYYLIFNIATLSMQYFIKRYVNEDEIKKRIENKVKILNKNDIPFSERIIKN